MTTHPHTRAFVRQLLVCAVQFVMIVAAVFLLIFLVSGGRWPF